MRGIKHKTGISVGRVTVYVGGCGHACAQVGVTIHYMEILYGDKATRHDSSRSQTLQHRGSQARLEAAGGPGLGKGCKGGSEERVSVRVVRLRGGLSPPRRRLSKCFTHLHAVDEANHHHGWPVPSARFSQQPLWLDHRRRTAELLLKYRVIPGPGPAYAPGPD